MINWISVEDGLPELKNTFCNILNYSDNLLVATGSGRPVMIAHFCNDKWTAVTGEKIHKVTHYAEINLPEVQE